MRHIEFSQGNWFLQDLQNAQHDDELEFSYQLPPDLKLTINPKGYKADGDDDDDDEPFQRADDQFEPVISKDIDQAEINIGNALAKNALPRDRKSLLDKEPEPEHIKSSDSESGSARKNSQSDSAKIKEQKRPNSFTRLTNSQTNQGNTNVSAEEISEELGLEDDMDDD